MSRHRQTWLRTNRRALSLAMVAPALLAVGGVAVAVISSEPLFLWIGGGTLVISACLSAMILWSMTQPRLAYAEGELLVYLRPGRPVSVPIEVVECFFMGQGPSLLSGGGEAAKGETSTIVVRLAEAAEEWKHVDVKPGLGHWCDGYITVRGTWCEPIDGELVKSLNHRLVSAKRDRRTEAVGAK